MTRPRVARLRLTHASWTVLTDAGRASVGTRSHVESGDTRLLRRQRRHRFARHRGIVGLRRHRADLHHGRRRHQHVGHPRRIPVRVAQAHRRLHRPRAREVHRAGRRAAPKGRMDCAEQSRCGCDLRRRRRPRQRPDVAAVPRHQGRTDLPAALRRRRARCHPARTQREDVHHVGRALRRAVHADRADRARSRRRGLHRAVRVRAQPQGVGAGHLQQRPHRLSAAGGLAPVS